MTRECLVDKGLIIGDNASAIVVDDSVVNIDSWDDVAFGEFLLTRNT